MGSSRNRIILLPVLKEKHSKMLNLSLWPTYSEDIRCCAFVGGFKSYEGDAVIKRRVAQHTRPENGVFWDVTCRVDACKNVRQTLLDSFGVPIPHQLLRAGLLHFTLRRQEGKKHERSAGKYMHQPQRKQKITAI